MVFRSSSEFKDNDDEGETAINDAYTTAFENNAVHSAIHNNAIDCCTHPTNNNNYDNRRLLKKVTKILRMKIVEENSYIMKQLQRVIE